MAVTTVTATVTSVQLLPANAGRYGVTIYNDSAATLYLLCASGTASSSNLTMAMPGGSLYQVPFSYTGELNGIWTAADGGSARITET